MKRSYIPFGLRELLAGFPLFLAIGVLDLAAAANRLNSILAVPVRGRSFVLTVITGITGTVLFTRLRD